MKFIPQNSEANESNICGRIFHLVKLHTEVPVLHTRCAFLVIVNTYMHITLVGSKGFWRWCMTHRITEFLDFFHRPMFYKIENTTFRKLDLFPKRRVFYFLEYQTMERVQKSSNPVYYIRCLTTLASRLYSVDNRMINKYGGVGWMRTCRGNYVLGEKNSPRTICTPQIPHYLTVHSIYV
jgi:hypothetical protein